jgi:signal transduction histidine kinase
MKQSLRFIHVEDSQEDSELVQHLLRADGFECDVKRVETRGELVSALQEPRWDLILSDNTLPQFRGQEALGIARATNPEIPFIFVSGTIGEETAIKSLHDSATDYVLKQQLSRLIPAVRRALTEAEGQKARHAMELQLRHARKLEAIGTFVGGIVHDFRNLLQVLKLNVQELPLVANDPNQVIEAAERLNRATDRGCEMMEELLVFARKTDARLQLTDLAMQIRATTRLLSPGLPENVKIAFHLEENMPDVLTDAGQIDRILTNLIGNARDAMPMGGTITISTDLIQFASMPSDVSPTRETRYLRVNVSDTGMGMDEETQSRIFEPFYTTKPAGKGTGLGLAVVFGLMEAHHGFIDLTSRIGEGTTLSLFFPLPTGTHVAPERFQSVCPAQFSVKPA